MFYLFDPIVPQIDRCDLTNPRFLRTNNLDRAVDGTSVIPIAIDEFSRLTILFSLPAWQSSSHHVFDQLSGTIRRPCDLHLQLGVLRQDSILFPFPMPFQKRRSR